jgi:ribosomal protein S18 acetylase RimI-like enzyme
MNDQPDKLLRLTKKERNAASLVLAQAFAEYELFQYYFPDVKERQAVLSTFCFLNISVCLKYGEVYASSPNMEGVSAWLPPGKTIGGWQIIRSVTPSVLFNFRRQGASRMRAYGRYVDDLHRRLVPNPHWYLQIIGVQPKYQGRGFCSRLVKPMLERTDREKLPCYLETNTKKNVSIYQRFGFEVVSEDKIPGTDLMNFAMLRRVNTTHITN